MSNYDLISFDMDGTLLNSDKKISQTTLQAIRTARSAGKTVIIATGRTLAELQEYREVLADVRYYICESGALIYDSAEQRILHFSTFPDDVTSRIMDLAEVRDLMLYIASRGEILCCRKDIPRMEHFHIGQYRDLVERIAILREDLIADYRKNPFPIGKLNIFSTSPEEREDLRAQLAALPITIADAEETSLELSPLHISKAFGLRKLCELLYIPLDRTIAVGDSDNDSSILRQAGLSVAMGNAHAHIKDLCDVVTADNDHDGCAQVIEKYLLDFTI